MGDELKKKPPRTATMHRAEQKKENKNYYDVLAKSNEEKTNAEIAARPPSPKK